MSKGNPLVVLRLVPEIADQVDKDIKAMNRNRPKAENTRSSWIRAAIVEKLAHRQRSKKHAGRVERLCCECGKLVKAKEVAWERQLLTGGKEFCCVTCDSAGK